MKKIILSLGVILTFLAYSIHQKTEGDDAQVIAPSSLQVTPTTGSSMPPTNNSGQMMNSMMGNFKDGSYTGSAEDVFYGNIQVKATISAGKITDVQFLQYPNDRGTSIMINTQAMPFLKQEAIQAQSAQVDIVSGATDSSEGFRRSLANALAQAK